MMAKTDSDTHSQNNLDVLSAAHQSIQQPTIRSSIVPEYLHPLCLSVIDKVLTTDKFWEMVEAIRTPLIEEDAEYPSCNIVTFLYQYQPSLRHICIQHGFGQPVERKMQRLGDTDILHLSYRFEKNTRLSYGFAEDMPLVHLDSLDDDAAEKNQAAYFDYLKTARFEQDKFNPRQFSTLDGDGGEDILSLLTLENALSDRNTVRKDIIDRGWLHREEFASQILNNSRDVWVYTPAGYENSTNEYPVLMFFDGGAYLGMGLAHRILDNLIAEEKIPPMIAVFVANAPAPARQLELPCSESFAQFIEEEMIPWLSHHYPISPLPIDWYLAGSSFGGLAATWLAFKMPHQIGNVIAQSGSFWWGKNYPLERQASPLTADYQPQWLIDEIKKGPYLPVRFWLEVGRLEPAGIMLEANRAMRDAMQEKGFDLMYNEFGGAHSFAHWRTSLPQALVYMLGQ
ncbi:MAG: DUF3327 domain-containing protein [Pseudomonadales bacterium]|nr:DUF3327 domain-containing protein [Pseudomonadales bacterium]